MRKEKRVVEIQEEVAILQDDHKIILEKGDKIRILKEAVDKRLVRAFNLFIMDKLDILDEWVNEFDASLVGTGLEVSESDLAAFNKYIDDVIGFCGKRTRQI